MDSNHEIQHEKSSENHREEKKDVVAFAASICITNLIHNVCPSFKSNDLELGEDGASNIVPIGESNTRVSERQARVILGASGCSG